MVRKRKRTQTDPSTSEKPSNGKTIGRKVRETFDVPEETFHNLSQMQLVSNREAVIEGCRGVLEYDDTIIRIGTDKLEIKFRGDGLTLRCLNSDNIVVEGTILMIEFIP